MSNSIRVIILAVIVSVTATVLTFGFYLYQTARYGMAGHQRSLSRVFNDSSGPRFASYDQRIVDGEFVKGCIDEFGGDYFIRVRTSANPVTFCVLDKPIGAKIAWEDGGGLDFCSLTDPGSLCYVPAEEMFDVTVLRKDRDIYGVYFEQQGIKDARGSSTYRGVYGSDLSVAGDRKKNKLDAAKDSIDPGSVNSSAATMESKNEGLEGEIADLKARTDKEMTGDVASNQVAFNSAYESYVDAKEEAEDAFDRMIAQCRIDHPDWQVLGHVDLDPDDNSGTEKTSLKFWKDRFEGR